MEGQISNSEFLKSHKKISYSHDATIAVTKYGKSTFNYWMQHSDGSWTNYDCKTG